MGVKRAGTVCAAWMLAVSLMGGSGAHGQAMDDGMDLPGPSQGLAVQGNGGLVAVLRDRGAEVRALGRVGDLEGWLVVPAGQAPYTLYTDGTGHAVMGLLFSPEGKALSAGQVRAAQETVGRRSGPEPVVRTRVGSKGEGRLPRGEARRSPVVQRDLFPGAAGAAADPDAAACAAGKAEAPLARKEAADTGASERSLRGIFEAALAVEGFDLGERGPEVTIFADPTCLPSRAAVAELARRALEGGIRLRVVPVGARGAEAEALAGLVLGSENRARTWFTLDRDGEWPALAAGAAAGVALNRRLFDRTGSEFVPLVLLRGTNGKVRSAIGLDFRRWFGDGAAR